MASVAFITAAALSGILQTAQASAISSALNASLSAIREAYTTNAICSKSRCINPIFPGMEDLHNLGGAKWISSSLFRTSKHMGFCKNAVTYDPALPAPVDGQATVESMVQRQDNAASTMFLYHLSGLGMDAWDYRKPEFSGNDCIKSIWRLTCFTYFPRSQVGSQDGGDSPYIRPCRSSCMNYIQACNVECCDESVQCVFQHKKRVPGNKIVTTEGYLPHDGPSSLCTGGAHRGAKPFGILFWALVALRTFFSIDLSSLVGSTRSALGFPRKMLWIGCLVVMALSLQGCDYDVPIHRVGNWRGQPDYLIKYEFIPPGGAPSQSTLNSCSLVRLSQTLQCSGRGVCKMWDSDNFNNKLTFCECDRDWADPECRTRRKSQMVTYGLSMFFGFLGADRFYLADNGGGVMKLLTFGGFGTWWVYDIIRTGSAPVDTGNFKVAADLPHYAFVLSCTMWGITLGFVLAYHLTRKFRSRRRREAMMLQLDEEARQQEPAKQFTDFYGPGIDKPVIQNYGSMKPGMNPSMDRYDPFSAPNGPPTMSFNGPQTMPPGSFQ